MSNSFIGFLQVGADDDSGVQPAGFLEDENGKWNLIAPDGSASALSELIEETLADQTATTVIKSAAGAYTGYRCTTIGGNITVYDNTAASGKVLVPTTALALGSFPAYGAGHPGRIVTTLGVTVVLSGAGVVYVGAE